MSDGDSKAGVERRLREVEGRLRESEERFEALVNGTGDGVFMVDPAGCFVFVNDFIAHSSGFPKAAFVGRHYLELIGAEHRPSAQRHFERALAGETVPAFELAYATAGDDSMWVEIKPTALIVDGTVAGVFAISRNVQTRKAMELALRESEAKYRSLIEALPHAVSIIQDGKVVFANPATTRLLGRDPMNAAPLDSYVIPSERERIREILRRRAAGEHVPRSYQATIGRLDGSEVPVEVYAEPMQFQGRSAVQCIAIDVSERARLEAQIAHGQRMEALGTLAGGIAHDFNNLLTAILATSDLMQRRHRQGADFEAAEVIMRAAQRAADLTRQLLGFARRSNPERVPVDVHHLIDEVCDLVGCTAADDIELVKRLQAPHRFALGDPGQLEQVLLNLAVNARDAMDGGGALTIETRSVALDGGPLLESFELLEGPYLQVTVRDTGPGITDEVRERIFEPFFTTKAQGKGSGMGLAVAYGIVRAHHGAIAVDTALQRGTAFHIYLPAASADALVSAAPSKTAQPGRGVVLVVDDEELMLAATRGLLHSLGYVVIECASGEEAIEQLRAVEGEVDVAIIDVRMPGMNGWSTLMSSGDDVSAPPDVDAGSFSVLPKPYGVEQLASAVARHVPRTAPS